LEKYQIERSKPTCETLDAEENKLHDMLADGKTAGEIALEIKRTRQAVYARVQRIYQKRRENDQSQPLT
jgi:DNA-binding NarL/FixJ family response regulator